MSNRYGSNPDYVLAGGGNTSYKDEQYLYVKASGTALADITAEGFVKMDRAALDRIFARGYPLDAQAREARVLQDMLAACCDETKPGMENSEATEPRRRRPSVEALLHHILPWACVLHVHPAMVNGMTCGAGGADLCAQMFPDAAWIPQIMPGYILAKEAKTRIKPGTRLVFLENHGVFIGGESVEEIDNAVAQMNAALGAVIARRPDTDLDVMDAVSSRERFARIHTTFTPDHMVYCGDRTLFIESEDELPANPPKIVGLKNVGVRVCGGSEREADIAMAVYLDAVKIAVYGESFGGAKPMCDALVREINGWEVERYRRSVSFGGGV
jgi:rhamnose utilization protein RhaD (predicted bifunctional aldolase and dehydrogenase)